MNTAKKSLINWNFITGHGDSIKASALCTAIDTDSDMDTDTDTSASSSHYSAVLGWLNAESSPPSLANWSRDKKAYGGAHGKQISRSGGHGEPTGDSLPGRELSEATPWLISGQTESQVRSIIP